jgi:ArsR family transcriptional regulator, arsenate/arsenite/antimonite-responsive transcriptional repressor
MDIYIRGDWMNNNYDANAKIFKTLSDQNRLKIIDMLSCGEKCACDILEYFDFTQPTLSHHMKVLMDSGLVKCRKEGLWSYYSLDIINSNKLVLSLMNLITDTEDCICKDIDKNKCNCASK